MNFTEFPNSHILSEALQIHYKALKSDAQFTTFPYVFDYSFVSVPDTCAMEQEMLEFVSFQLFPLIYCPLPFISVEAAQAFCTSLQGKERGKMKLFNSPSLTPVRLTTGMLLVSLTISQLC